MRNGDDVGGRAKYRIRKPYKLFYFMVMRKQMKNCVAVNKQANI